MKAIIEKTSNKDFFERILYVISNSDSESVLRNRMTRIFTLFIDSSDFDFGFAGNHMWVSDIHTNERLVLVPLNNKRLNLDEFNKVKGRLESIASLLDAVGTIFTETQQEDKLTQIRCLIEDFREDLEEEYTEQFINKQK